MTACDNYHAVAYYFDKMLEEVRCDVAQAKNGGPYNLEDQQKIMEWRELLPGEDDV